MSTPPVDPSVAAGGGSPPDSTDPAGRRPPSRSADPGQGSHGGFTGQDPSAQPQPKGRDDDELADALRVRLGTFGDIDTGAVLIDVDDGCVILRGEVVDAQARDAVEARVAEVLGVSSVDNRLAIRPD